MTAEKTIPVTVRIPEKIKAKLDKKYPGYYGRKTVASKVREFYATLLQK